MMRMMLSEIGLTIYRVVLSEAARFPELARAFYDAGPARAMRHLADWLAMQTEHGRLLVDDPVFAAEQFFALTQTRLSLRCRLRLQDCGDDAELEHVVDEAVTMFLARYGVGGSHQKQTVASG